MWIKLCGLTHADAVHAAIDLAVDAVGFVFAPSRRQVNAQQALQLARDVPRHMARVAVMLHPHQSLVDEVLQVFKPDVLQTDWQDFAVLQLPDELQRLPVLRAGTLLPDELQRLPVLRAGTLLPAELPARFLFEGAVSGTGEKADWSQAAQRARQGELILAGGLHPGNVQQAIAAVRPFGVDVSSGIESAPGVKDIQKMLEFVQAARHAAAE